jgi:hypothetical protein
LVEDDPVPQYNAANNTSIIKAGALRGSGPKEDGTGILLVLGFLKPRKSFSERHILLDRTPGLPI